jgi:hypothetical protein
MGFGLLGYWVSVCPFRGAIKVQFRNKHTKNVTGGAFVDLLGTFSKTIKSHQR